MLPTRKPRPKHRHDAIDHSVPANHCTALKRLPQPKGQRMPSPKLTPMLKQYLDVKATYPDTLLFYRMGDFYEMFFEDAEKAARLLEITLTSRNKKDQSPVPMCGVPVKAVQGYIARLIEKGHKVAICDQVEDPASAKGLVKREVVRVITPGMIVEDALLDGKTHNFVLAVNARKGRYGLSCLDISTGTFRLAETGDGQTIVDEALRIAPREILMPEALANDALTGRLTAAMPAQAVSFLEDTAFSAGHARDRLTAQFGTLNLEGFGCEGLAAGIGAAGAVLSYVKDTQLQAVAHITGIQTYHLDQYLLVDALSCRNLELLRGIQSATTRGTLLEVIDFTVTAMGGRLFKQWLRYPLIDAAAIDARLTAVDEAVDHLSETRQVRDRFKSVHDLERLAGRLALGHATARDLVAIQRSLVQLPDIQADLEAFSAPLFRWTQDMAPLAAVADLVENAIREDAPPTIHEGGMIRKGFNPELDELIAISSEGKGWLLKLEAQEKDATGINTLKVRFNKVFGYYLEVPKSQSDAVPPHYVRKQTLVNAERYITDELKTFEDKVLNAEERRCALEREIFETVRAAVMKSYPDIRDAAAFLASLDCLLGLAAAAVKNDYRRPAINIEGRIHINNGRHPVIEKMIPGERFVPNTIAMDDTENQVLVITGPNMAGKSTVLRQVALTVIMAQMGGFVPAESADIAITDRIFTRVGALDNLSQGQSTFMVEMQETANILHAASSKSLVIMDEIGRGTSTFDGLSIAWAVAEYLHDANGHGVKTLFATHYHELTELADQKGRVKNYNIAVKEWNDDIIFLRKLVPGGTNRSYGIQVARLAGIPVDVIKRAKQILFDIENDAAAPRVRGSGDDPSGAHVQLGLFAPGDHPIISKLKKLDISTMTPLEALNLLHTLTEKLHSDAD
jgi:DNA mismatch repair protein MutS